MSNLHASSSSAQWQTDQVHENHTSTLYTSAAAVEAFVDKPLKSHDVIVFHKDNRFSLLPINTCTCLPSTWAIHQLSSFWFYTARHNVINANLYQIPDNHLHSITTQRPSVQQQHCVYYDFVVVDDEKKNFNLLQYSQLSQSHFVRIMVYPLENIDFVIGGVNSLCSQCIPDLNDQYLFLI